MGKAVRHPLVEQARIELALPGLHNPRDRTELLRNAGLSRLSVNKLKQEAFTSA